MPYWLWASIDWFANAPIVVRAVLGAAAGIMAWHALPGNRKGRGA